MLFSLDTVPAVESNFPKLQSPTKKPHLNFQVLEKVLRVARMYCGTDVSSNHIKTVFDKFERKFPRLPI